jgi:aminobenzoyl-glutamate utilization protein A
MTVVTATLRSSLIEWRRDFHRHPELGFLEYRTAARVCAELSRIPGCELRVGEEVMAADARMTPPTTDACAQALEEARAAGADPAWLARMGDGLTGVVAEWRFPRPGPVVAFRFDLDALPVLESADDDHRPVRDGFASRRAGRMHACGHDGHTAIGLALGACVPRMADGWAGTLRLIFQPAEEGCRGAKSLVEAGVVDDVDRLVCAHLGSTAPRTGTVACGTEGWFATTKFDVRFEGEAAHAGADPHLGRNALLAAAATALHLHALTRHGEGETRVNVGALRAGSGRNVVADRAELHAEVRGSSVEIRRFMMEQARRVVDACAALHGVTAEIEVVGEAGGAHSDEELRQVVAAAAATVPGVHEIVDVLPAGGSEDATLLMEAVQRRGGQATYLLVGSALPAGHHQPRFDVDDEALTIGAELLVGIADRLLGAQAA